MQEIIESSRGSRDKDALLNQKSENSQKEKYHVSY